MKLSNNNFDNIDTKKSINTPILFGCLYLTILAVSYILYTTKEAYEKAH